MKEPKETLVLTDMVRNVTRCGVTRDVQLVLVPPLLLDLSTLFCTLDLAWGPIKGPANLSI